MKGISHQTLYYVIAGIVIIVIAIFIVIGVKSIGSGFKAPLDVISKLWHRW